MTEVKLPEAQERRLEIMKQVASAFKGVWGNSSIDSVELTTLVEFVEEAGEGRVPVTLMAPGSDIIAQGGIWYESPIGGKLADGPDTPEWVKHHVWSKGDIGGYPDTRKWSERYGAWQFWDVNTGIWRGGRRHADMVHEFRAQGYVICEDPSK